MAASTSVNQPLLFILDTNRGYEEGFAKLQVLSVLLAQVKKCSMGILEDQLEAASGLKAEKFLAAIGSLERQRLVTSEISQEGTAGLTNAVTKQTPDRPTSASNSTSQNNNSKRILPTQLRFHQRSFFLHRIKRP